MQGPSLAMQCCVSAPSVVSNVLFGMYSRRRDPVAGKCGDVVGNGWRRREVMKAWDVRSEKLKSRPGGSQYPLVV
jgi:hypothetical protein